MLRVTTPLHGYHALGVLPLVFEQAMRSSSCKREAATEFQKVLDHRGIVLADPIGALAHLQQGRAYLALGNIADALRSYEAFFAGWKYADDEIPILQQARSEYAHLG